MRYLWLNKDAFASWVLPRRRYLEPPDSFENRSTLLSFETSLEGKKCISNSNLVVARLLSHQVLSDLTPLRCMHTLKKAHGQVRKVWRRCIGCYKRNKVGHTSKEAQKITKQVTTFCDDCPGMPYLCLDCFKAHHE